MKCRIAMIQMHVEASKIEQNLQLATTMIRQAVKSGCDIVVLPECFDLGWSNPQGMELAHPIPGYTSNCLCKLAEDEQIYIVAGITEKAGVKLYNTALFISNTGDILSKYRKINLLPEVEGIYNIGDTLSVKETPFGKIGINICADNLQGSTNIAHTLARMGAQIIISPSSWAVPPGFDHTKTPYGSEWLEPYTQLTQLYDITIVAVSNVGPVTVGPWRGWRCIGNSIAMGPGGQVITILPHGEDKNYIEIIEVIPQKQKIIGTDFPAALKRKGYIMN